MNRLTRKIRQAICEDRGCNDINVLHERIIAIVAWVFVIGGAELMVCLAVKLLAKGVF